MSSSSSSTSSESASGQARASLARRAFGFAAAVAGLLAAAVYLAQFMTLSPWDPDGGLLLGYIHQVAQGERPYFDFVDVYGPLSWLLPAGFYEIYGERVWGVRVLLLLLKLSSVGLTFVLVRRLAHPFYAGLASFWMTLLLGMPWPYLQMAYGFHQALPLILSTWLFVLVRPLRRPSLNLVAAAAAITVVVWLKVNTGLFLLAGGLLCCFCWTPVGPGADGPKLERWQGSFRAAQWIGLASYGLVFATFMAGHFDRFFFLYLALPLGLALAAATGRVAEAGRAGEGIGAGLRAWGTLLATFLVLSATFVAFYFGASVFDYAFELAAVLSKLDYASPLPPLGEPGTRPHFNEWYWLQLPWLTTAAFAAWWLVAGRSETAGTRSALHGLFVFVALGGFVVYSRADEPHVFQAVVPAVPALFVFVGRLEATLVGRSAALTVGFRSVVGLLAIAYGSTIAFGSDARTATSPGWSQPSMQPIRYQPYPHRRDVGSARLVQRIDEATDQTARYVDEISEDGSEVWVVTRRELVNFLSHTRPAGGRYKYVLYLAKAGFLDRDALEALVPASVLDGLRRDPPRVVVTGVDASPRLFDLLPEVPPVLASRYHVAKRFGGLQVLIRDEGG